MIEHCRQAWRNSIEALRRLAEFWNGHNGETAARLRREANGMEAQAMSPDEEVERELASIQQTIDASQEIIDRHQAEIDQQRDKINELKARAIAIREGWKRDRLTGHPDNPRGYARAHP